MAKASDETDIRLWHEHKVLKAIHLQGHDVTVEIESVTPGKITGVGGKSDAMPIAKFKGKDLPFGLNKTNTATLVSMFGKTAKGMVGRKITLFPTTCKGKEGQVVECIRIRPTPADGQVDPAENFQR